jgi:O-antigen/teichoic acid export membrane protein
MISVALLGFVKLFILAKVLGVEGFGYYIFFITIETYLVPLLTGGLLESVFRQYPILLGQGDRSGAEGLRNRAFATVFSIVLIELLLVFFVAFILLQIGESDWSLWLFVAAVHIAITTFYFMVLREIRSRLKSVEYSLAMFARGLIDVTVLLFFLDSIGILFYLILEVAVLALIFGFLLIRIPRLWNFGQSGSLQGMAHTGLALLGSSSVGTFAITGDRVLLGIGLSAQKFSSYAFNGIIFQGGMSFANVVHQYIQPLIMQAYGRDGCIDNIYYELHKWFRRLLVMGLIVSPLAWFVYAYIATGFYPEYQFGTVLFFCLFLAAIVHVGNAFGLILIAAGEFKILFLCQLSLTVFLLVFIGVGILLNFSLEYFAVTFLACRVLSLVVLVSNSRRLLKPQ